MGLVWNVYPALGMGLGVAALGLALAIFLSRPWSPRNRWLAIVVAGEMWMFWLGLSWSVDDVGAAYGGRQVYVLLFHLAIPCYVFYASTLDTPYARWLRTPWARAFLGAWLVGVAVLVLGWPQLFSTSYETGRWYANIYVRPGPAHRLLSSIAGLALWFVAFLAISSLRRSPPGSVRRREMAFVTTALLWRDITGGVLLLLYPYLRFRVEALYVLAGLVLPAVAFSLLSYAILRHQFFEVRVQARRASSAGLDAQREHLYRAALEGLGHADDPAEAQRLLASLRRTLRISAGQHANLAARTAREDLTHRVERRGRFEVQRELGRGGHGRALLARDLDLDRDVVLKEPRPARDGGPGRQRFLAEARAAARFHHPNLVSVLGILADEEPPMLVLEYAPGGSVQELLEREGPVGPERAAAIAIDVLSGLALLHRDGLVHRDIKPDNIFLDEEGKAKLGDFGLATRASNELAGTPGFIAPEVEEGRAADVRSDLWSVGAVLYALASGSAPVTYTTADARRPQATLDPRRPALPASPLSSVIERAMDPNPRQRYDDAAAMAAHLEAALAGTITSRVPAAARTRAAGRVAGSA